MDKKKAFQKVIGEIRKDWRVKRGTPHGQFPKAMMTGQQEEKNTATVNCGAEWCSFSKELSEFVMKDSRFLKFLSDFGATARIEEISSYRKGFQIRLTFKEKSKDDTDAHDCVTFKANGTCRGCMHEDCCPYYSEA